MAWAHRSCSDRSSRAISSGTASARRMSLEQNAVHHLHNGHVDVVPVGERERARRRRRRLRRPSPCPASARSSDAPLPDLDADRAIATQRARAREHEIADAGESGERRRARAKRDAEPRHLVQSARDERRARVVAQPNAFDDSGRDGHDVLERAAELDADHVVVRVDAEGAELLSAACATRAARCVRRRRDDRRRLPRHDFRREARPRDADDGAARDFLGDDRSS